MPETISQAYIFVPMLVVVALTFVAFVKMGAARGAAMKTGIDANYYKAHIGGPEPEAARAAARHWDNMFELPTLFYGGCIIAFVLSAVSFWTVLFAWIFVLGRVVQSAIHMTYNNPAHRGLGFTLSVIAALALWVNVGMSIFAAV